MTKRASRPRYALRVIRGGYAPADAFTAASLRKRHRVGDLVFAEFKRPRNPGFHRLAHQLGTLLAENIEAFAGLESHDVLKRMQVEGGIGCDVALVDASSMWSQISEAVIAEVPQARLVMAMIGELLVGKTIPVKLPRSLSYESMDEDEFHAVIAGMCAHVSAKYWKDCTPEQIEAMASVYVEAA
ncbi:hypothetical protein MBSD_n2130 [Mizugakiibacter sediminis]|uniref:Uncharacterized protein n=1 Tax=Mizugakiibacter sediminis TaxID=1475481 RepID=A0A0K8QPJ7_9GAMM|nr:hypothetical protein [Mizugakiibacter sediminis]GAP66815.1 hypothetical protein MBSD_n2130 [Mizugakiibacter sediminis]